MCLTLAHHYKTQLRAKMIIHCTSLALAHQVCLKKRIVDIIDSFLQLGEQNEHVGRGNRNEHEQGVL